MIITLLVAVAIGAAIALQAVTIGDAATTVHPLAVSLSLLAAGLVVGAVWATIQGTWAATASVARYWWWLPLGALGWVIVGVLGWTVGRLGAAMGLSVVIAAQLATALAIDVTRGAAHLDVRHILGVVLVVVGATVLGLPD